MTCEQCVQMLLDSGNSPLREDWMPEVSVLNLAKLHAENCLVCTAKMAEISRLNYGLGQLRLSNMLVEAPATIESNLLLEFRRRSALRAPIVPCTARWKLVWAPAIALALVAALIFYSVPRARPHISVQTNGTGHHARQPASPLHSRAGFDRTSIENHQGGADRPRLTSSGRKPQTNLSRKPHDRARPEAPWRARDELSLNGGGNVVRVTLPLSGLVAMGVPIYPEVSDRRVTADVARDPFGAVIAIHLVESRPSTN